MALRRHTLKISVDLPRRGANLIYTSPVAPDSLANEQAVATWSNRACGTLNAGENAAAGSLAFFSRMAERRYRRDDPWIPAVLDFASMAGKQVLEIGHGMGCDLVHAAKAGATVHGVDITTNHHEIARKHFAANWTTRPIFVSAMQASSLSPPTASTSSSPWQCCTTSTTPFAAFQRRIACSSPAGCSSWRCTISGPCRISICCCIAGICEGDLRRLGYRNLLSTVEGGADGVTIKPLVKLYSRRIVRTILADFSETDIRICGLAYERTR